MFLERRDKEANYYSKLQKQTLDRLQELSGKIWTDFNSHDPGITIADAFNYALFELHYIFQFPFESFLHIEHSDNHNYLKKDLFGVKDIFEGSIVTPSDYESLIKENVNKISACHVYLDDNKLYRIEIETSDNDKEKVINKIETLYHKHRNLCENLGEVTILDTLATKGDDTGSFYPQTLKRKNINGNYQTVPQTYYSIQNHFPGCYGLSERGISNNSSNEYKAQVMQLKAYLLIFDYLLADVENQAKNIFQLLSLSYKSVDIALPEIKIKDIEELIDREKENSQTVHSDKLWNIQKSRFLDVLDSIYGEDSKSFFSNLDIAEQNRKRTEIIPLLAESNKNRFRSFNILDIHSKAPSLKKIIGLVAGIDIKEEIPLSNIFARYRLQLIDDKIFYQKYKQRISVDISDETDIDILEKVPSVNVVYDDSRYEELYSRINLLWYNILYQSFLIYGSDISNYRIIDKWKKGYLLIFKIPKGKGYLVLGQFYEKEVLIETANLFCRFVKQLSVKSQNFHLLEHILLNYSISKCLDYNKLSVIFPYWANTFGREKYQDRIKDRLPAHIRVEFIALSMHNMALFENVYYKWRVALSRKDNKQAEIFSTQLLNILDLAKKLKDEYYQ